MQYLLFVLAVLALLLGVFILLLSKSAIHEIQAMIFFLIATVLFVGAAIVEAIKRQKPAPLTQATREQQARVRVEPTFQDRPNRQEPDGIVVEE